MGGWGYSPHSLAGAVGRCLLVAPDEESWDFLLDEHLLVAACAVVAADWEEAREVGGVHAWHEGCRCFKALPKTIFACFEQDQGSSVLGQLVMPSAPQTHGRSRS